MEKILKTRIWPIAVIVALIICLGAIMAHRKAIKVVVDPCEQSLKNVMQQEKKKQ